MGPSPGFHTYPQRSRRVNATDDTAEAEWVILPRLSATPCRDTQRSGRHHHAATPAPADTAVPAGAHHQSGQQHEAPERPAGGGHVGDDRRQAPAVRPDHRRSRERVHRRRQRLRVRRLEPGRRALRGEHAEGRLPVRGVHAARPGSAFRPVASAEGSRHSVPDAHCGTEPVDRRLLSHGDRARARRPVAAMAGRVHRERHRRRHDRTLHARLQHLGRADDRAERQWRGWTVHSRRRLRLSQWSDVEAWVIRRFRQQEDRESGWPATTAAPTSSRSHATTTRTRNKVRPVR